MRRISSTNFANHVGSHLAEVRSGGVGIVITRFNAPVAAVISLADLDCLISGRQVNSEALEAALVELEADIAAIRAAESGL